MKRAGLAKVAQVRVSRGESKSRLTAIIYAEFLLLIKGLSWWWHLVIAGLNFYALWSSTEDVLGGILPIVWIWPILVWSKLGSREVYNNTRQIVFSTPRPVSQNLSAIWLAGVLFSVLVSIGVGVHLVLAGQLVYLMGWIACLVFVPSFAIALSVLSGSHRLFEVLYLLWWYIAINKVPEMDFMGHTASAIEIGMPFVYLGISLILIIHSFASRDYQVGYRFDLRR